MSWRLQEDLRSLHETERPYGHFSQGGGVRYVLAFANTYHVAMSNLGYQTVFEILSRRPGIDCQRAFLPEPDDLAEHNRTGTKWLTLERQQPVAEAEVIVFSLPFENDYLNLVTLLKLAGLQPLARNRGVGHPLILAGGIAPTLNPETLAPFVDLILIGEAEGLLDDYLDCVDGLDGISKVHRDDYLEKIVGSVEGVYAPTLYSPSYDKIGCLMSNKPQAGLPTRINRRYALDLSRPVESSILTDNTEFDNRVLIELSRGCGRACRFCAAGFTIRPHRSVPFERLIDSVSKASEDVGRIGLVSAAVSDLEGIEMLCQSAVQQGGKVSVSSLRADTLSPGLAELLKEAGVRTITLAPEAGSERMRRVINKGLDENDILEAALVALEAGIRSLRLYFMIGLPTEIDEDVIAIADLTKKILDHIQTSSEGNLKLNWLTLSVGSFVPKPNTPFQWTAMDSIKELKRKGKLLKKELKGLKRVKIAFDQPKWAHVEGLLARGDRRVGELLLTVEEQGGDWKNALKQTGLDAEFYTMRQRDQNEIFPWEIIDTGVSRDYLWDEWQRGIQAKPSPVCKPDTCDRCGVCN